MGVATVAIIVEETTAAIWKKLRPVFLPTPTVESMQEVAKNYYSKCNFPNVIGAIDGKHIRIKCPDNSGSDFYNYKQFFSIVLQAVADSDLRFIAAEVGAFGKESDGGIFARSDSKMLYERMSLLLGKKMLPDNSGNLPFFLIGDAAYPLKEYLMTPFSGPVREECNTFNYRLSRARRCVEYAFGMLAVKWRVLYTTINTKLSNTENIVLACVALHNAIITLEGTMDNTHEIEYFDDSNARERSGIAQQSHRGRPAQYPTWIRQKLLDFVNGPGALPWQ